MEHSLKVQPGWGKALSQAVEHKDKQLPVRRQDVGLQYPRFLIKQSSMRKATKILPYLM